MGERTCELYQRLRASPFVFGSALDVWSDAPTISRHELRYCSAEALRKLSKTIPSSRVHNQGSGAGGSARMAMATEHACALAACMTAESVGNSNESAEANAGATTEAALRCFAACHTLFMNSGHLGGL
jgi:hypothetical protein